MSTKEICIALLDTFTEAQLANAAAMLQAMKQDIDDDDAFCEQMYQNYLNDPDKGDPVPIEDFAKELGIQL